MPDGSTLTPASQDTINSILKMSDADRDELWSKFSPEAREGVLMQMRTMSQAQKGATKAMAGPLAGDTITRANPGRFGLRRDLEKVGPPDETLGQALLREEGPNLKYYSAGALTLAAPEAGIPAAATLAGIGGAGGEAAHQLLQHGMTPSEAPQESKEAATRIGKAGLTTAATELGFGVGTKALGYGLGAYLRHTDPLNYGVQQIFKGLNPPGSMPELRENIVAAADDLANVYSRIDKKLASPEVKGGLLNEDLRLRTTKEEINSYMKEMYQSERKGQIDVGTSMGSRVMVKGDPDKLQMIGKWLSRPKGLPLNSPQLRAAQSLAANPLRPINIADADALAKAVNEIDLKSAKERSLAGLLDSTKELDQGLKTGINDELQRIGQPGITSYERRYAALAQIRDLMESGMNAAEKRTFSQRLHSFVSLHGANVRTHIGGMESSGGLVQEGLESLKKAGKGGPGGSLARPPQIHEGQIVEPPTSMTRQTPFAAPAPSGSPFGEATPPPGLPRASEQKLLPAQAERRTTAGASPTGSERRKSVYESSVYSQPTEGEKLAADIRKQKAGEPSGIEEGHARNFIARNKQLYAKFRQLDIAANAGNRAAQKERDAMLIDAKNELISSPSKLSKISTEFTTRPDGGKTWTEDPAVAKTIFELEPKYMKAKGLTHEQMAQLRRKFVEGSARYQAGANYATFLSRWDAATNSGGLTPPPKPDENFDF